ELSPLAQSFCHRVDGVLHWSFAPYPALLKTRWPGVSGYGSYREEEEGEPTLEVGRNEVVVGSERVGLLLQRSPTVRTNAAAARSFLWFQNFLCFLPHSPVFISTPSSTSLLAMELKAYDGATDSECCHFKPLVPAQSRQVPGVSNV